MWSIKRFYFLWDPGITLFEHLDQWLGIDKKVTNLKILQIAKLTTAL